MAGPTGTAVTNIRAAKIGEHAAVVLHVFISEDAHLFFSGAQLGIEIGQKEFLQTIAKAKFPRFGRDAALFIRIFVHVEHVQLAAIDAAAIEHGGEFGVSRPRIRHDRDELRIGFQRCFNLGIHIGGPEKFHVSVREDRNAEIRIGVLRDIFAFNVPRAGDRAGIAKRNEAGGGEGKLTGVFFQGALGEGGLVNEP